MLVKSLIFALFAVYNVLAEQYLSLELNVLNDPSVVSEQIDFVNSRTITHDVNPGFHVNEVTQSGLLVWKSSNPDQRVTSSILYLDKYGPRLINLTVDVGNNQTQVLIFLYTSQGWVNLNDKNPQDINLDLPESDVKDTSPLNMTNGEMYFNKDSQNEEDRYTERPIELDLYESVNNKFNYTFKYSLDKYTYNYKPKNGYYVQTIREGNNSIWSRKNDETVTEIVVDKQSDIYVVVHVNYLDDDRPKSVLYIKENGEWKLSPTNKSSSKNENKTDKKPVNNSDDTHDENVKTENYTTLDYSNLPLPPLCRGCTYDIDGITHNGLYFSTGSKFRKFVEGKYEIVELPEDYEVTSSCLYTKNEKVLFVDILYTKDDKVHFLYFEKGENGYTNLTEQEFQVKFWKYTETPVTLDISKVSEGYTVETTNKNGIENKFYKPSEGYVIKTVADGDSIVLEVSSYVVDVTVNNLGGTSRLMKILYQKGSFYCHDYYTYFPELEKWTRVSEYFYYKMIDEFTQNLNIRHPTLDLSKISQVKKFMYITHNELFNYYTFNPKPGTLLSSVLDSGRMVWTPRYPEETCSFIWYNYKAQLLHVFSKSDRTLRDYYYEKSGEKWTFINEEDFKKMFSYIYARNITADIRYSVSELFNVEESGNMFYITPKNGYLVNRVRYGDKTIWVGSENLKCTSFYLVYGKYETYLHLTLSDSKLKTSSKYFKTTDGNMFKWRECESKCSDNDEGDKQSLLNKLSQDKTKNNEEKELKNTNKIKNEKLEKSSTVNDKSKNHNSFTDNSKKSDKEELTSKEEKANKENFLSLNKENRKAIEHYERLAITNEPFNDTETSEKPSELSNSYELETENESSDPTEERDEELTNEETKEQENDEKDTEVENNLEFESSKSENNFNNTNNSDDSASDSSFETLDEKKLYMGGRLKLENLKYSEYGEYRDAREFGYNYLLFTPYPDYPIKELSDGNEIIWKSHAHKCVALSVYLRDGYETMVELFIKNDTEVVRKHFEYSGYRWRPMRSEAYDYVCGSNKKNRKHEDE